VKLTAKIKLQPNPEQRTALLETIGRVNAACDIASEWAWQNKAFGQYKIHHGVYYDLKERFSLSAQVAVRAIAKVADSYKLDKKTIRKFRPLGSIAYDSRILRFDLAKGLVSIWTVEGRLNVLFVCGEYQSNLLAHQKGESDLAYIKGEFYLLPTCDVPDLPLVEPTGVIGVDLGIVNIATDSDGVVYSGKHLNSVRGRQRRLRQKLQKKQTKGAKRRLKRLSTKEQRFANHVNHTITKKLVETAKRTNRAVALEDLKGIRQRVRVRRPQRSTLHSWGFHDFGQKLSYKAQRLGVKVVFVDPRNSSRECPCCGHTDKANRPNQSTFKCRVCGFADHADKVAALNLSVRGWAAVNQPFLGIGGEPPTLGEASYVSKHGSVPESPLL
jgi:IS605 OrfB family transposase